MGKGAVASRVEKAQKPRALLPSWYHRVFLLRWGQSFFDDKDPSDFDEDLSELEDESEQEDDAGPLEEEHKEDCKCGGEDSECDCRFPDDELSEDDESERSYNESDADCYYGMKEEREERKREILREQKEKDQQLELERSKEEEVRAAFKCPGKARKESKTIPIGSLAGQYFRLFCSDYVDCFYDTDVKPIKIVTFFVESDRENPAQKSEDGTVMLYGCMYLHGLGGYDFGPFRLPRNAGWRPVKAKSCDGEFELSFQFLGNGYLKLRVSNDMIVDSYDEDSLPPDAPEVFDFVGIWCDEKELEAETQRLQREEELRRSPSPRESWFEMHHPMGAWRWRR